MTKPVFGVSEKASLDMVLSKKQITKALISLCGWAGWSVPLLFANPRRQVFSRQGPIEIWILFLSGAMIVLDMLFPTGKFFS